MKLPEIIIAEHNTLTFELDGKQVSVITFLPPGLLDEICRCYNNEHSDTPPINRAVNLAKTLSMLEG